jgi:thioredoxin 1
MMVMSFSSKSLRAFILIRFQKMMKGRESMSENQALSYLILASLLLLFCLNPAQSAADAAHRANILELNDKKVNAAINNTSLLILDCYAAWCEPCMNLNATIHELSRELKVPITFGQIDVEENEKTAERFNITEYPTILVFKKGILIHREFGFGSKSDFLDMLQEVDPTHNYAPPKNGSQARTTLFFRA